MTWKTPGVWRILPRGSKVRAELAGTILIGTLKEVSGEHRDTYMDLDAFPPLTTRIFARDGWEVTYETASAGDVIREAPIGTVWGTETRFYPSTVKISATHVSRQHAESEDSVIIPISNYDSWDSEAINAVSPEYLAKLARRG